ncbi:hypothetical protein EW026_g3976 [Hermanssonia centrifuga]|uniref:Tat pathway signal sequence n=1 Tax=Hermanssonia centrifuga TaxID=98765 RepID=A0A4S4KIJ5_9APHY|nr:hypothetical protein EW026_g3976 [Hermanssonia centrifuga]
MAHMDIEYKPLLTGAYTEDSPAESTGDDVFPAQRLVGIKPVIFWIVVVVYSTVTIFLAGALYENYRYECPKSSPRETLLYSPAQEAVVYEPKSFVLGHSKGQAKTIFGAEPSAEVDEAWNDLYNVFAVSQIPAAQAKLLPNKTLRVPGDTGNYIIGLSVFHELHCLDVIRKALNPDHYADPATGDIDMVRQALMCAADITPLIWQWHEDVQKARAAPDVVHICRNYDNIVQWAKAHRMKHHFDDTVHIEDDTIVLPLVYRIQEWEI